MYRLQLIQTTIKYGNPAKDVVGKFKNHETWKYDKDECSLSLLFLTMCCMPCTVRSALEKAIGMPQFIGCLSAGDSDLLNCSFF